MRRSLAILLSLAALSLFAGDHGGRHGYRNGRNVSISTSTDDDEQVTRCDQIRVSYDGDRVPMVEESVPVSGLRSLRVRPPQNGGVRVVGSNQSSYSVKACKATFLGRDARDIRVDLRGDELSASVPDDTDAVVYFLVSAPRNASLNLEAENGEIGVQDFTGTLTAHTTNGPISLKAVNGTIDAEAQNGPIAFSGGSGTVKLESHNGPVTIKLDGNAWQGGGLDAHSQNGPVSLKLPNNYRSGVVVESNGHGPMSCHAEACRQASRPWDDDSPRRIELGSGPAMVRVSTNNGPVSVRERD
jgi:DUF4097 and DUF4098 domain-containing protein YvlB